MTKEILNVTDLSVYTGFSKSHIYKLTHGRKIPFYCPGGKMVFFKKDEVDIWLLKNRKSTADEIENQAQKYSLTRK